MLHHQRSHLPLGQGQPSPACGRAIEEYPGRDWTGAASDDLKPADRNGTIHTGELLSPYVEKPRYINVDELQSQTSLDEAAAKCGVTLDARGHGKEVRIDCPFGCNGDH